MAMRPARRMGTRVSILGALASLVLTVMAVVMAYKAVGHPTLDTKQAFESLFCLLLVVAVNS